MELKDRLRRQLQSARQHSERLLEAFKTPEEWTKQLHASGNHALWFAGHMGISDNFFISLIDPQRAQEQPEYAKQFGVGSVPTSDPADYPASDQVLAYMRDRRAVLLELLEGMSEGDLARRLPDGTPQFLSDVGSVYEMAIWHEGMHSGQLTVCRRALGHPPLG